MDWRLDDNVLKFKYRELELFWVMPAGFSMPSAPRLSLATYLLLAPYGQKVPLITSSVSPGKQTAVAFSGGVDSAAALRLLPTPLPIYTQVANPSGLHKLDNALLAVREVDGLAIESNYNQLPKVHGRKIGFYGTAGFTVTSVLLSEHLGIQTVADGNILEYAYLRTSNGHGTAYHEHNYRPAFDAFRSVGMHYCMPCAGLTEVSTTKIARGYRYAMGCMRGTNGSCCLNCLKCYRKMAIAGTPIPSNPETERALAKDWIPVLGSLLWARDNCGLAHPRIDSIDRDYSWVDKWYPKSLDLVPEHLHDYLAQRIASFGIAPLVSASSLKQWSSYAPSAATPGGSTEDLGGTVR